MRIITAEEITSKLTPALVSACIDIPNDVLDALERAKNSEQSPLAKETLCKIIENDFLAKEKQMPTCQDTGICVCFVEIGYDVKIEGDLYVAINDAVKNAYVKAYFRKSVVAHPLDRINTNDNTPAIVHVKMVSGDKLKITIAPKGAGSENMSALKMLIPADGIEGVKKFVIDTVKNAGGKPCPPIVVGVGVGGNFEKCALLAKEALLREIGDKSSDKICLKLEEELLEEINALGIGTMGFGGTKTCLSVKVNSHPCHIASLPVAVNIQCHASRHKTIEI